MYGSSLRNVTFKPRLSSRLPIEAEASPFPKEETTPPVTKMNLLIGAPILSDRMILIRMPPLPGRGCLQCAQLPIDDVRLLELLRHRLNIFRRIHPHRGMFGFPDLDRNAMLQRAQLLELFRILQPSGGKRRQLQQGVAPVHIETEVNVVQPSDGSAARVVPHRWHSRPREKKG